MTEFSRCAHGKSSGMCSGCDLDKPPAHAAGLILPQLPHARSQGRGREDLSGITGLSTGSVSDGMRFLYENSGLLCDSSAVQQYWAPGEVICEDGRVYWLSADEDEIRQFAYLRPVHRIYAGLVAEIWRIEPHVQALQRKGDRRSRAVAREIVGHLESLIRSIENGADLL